MKEIIKSPYNKLIFSSLLIYLITAYFSIGFYHTDEHFQILEFANYKLGKSPAIDLPWEFQEKIRPTLQPIIALLLIKLFNIFSIYNPFTYSLLFRTVTALLSWFVICKLSLLLIQTFTSEIGKRIFLFLSLLLSFVPFLNVRFSSETYSAITFLSAIYFVIKYRVAISDRIEYKLIYVGLLLGFSFFFRFQIAFAIIGLVLWLVIINKTKWQNLILLAASGAVAMLVCIALDTWFYGQFEFTPYNYYVANIVQHKAANFGIEPWWYYLYDFSDGGFLPIRILLLLFFFFGLYKRPKDIFAWCLIPFIVAHFAVGHKEMRFMFPIVFGFTYMAAIGIDSIINSSKIKPYNKFIFLLIIILNIPSLFSSMFLPANSMLYSYKFLYEKSPPKEIIFIGREPNTFILWGLKINFYNSPKIKSIELTDDKHFENYLSANKSDTLYVLERKLLPSKAYAGYNSKCIFKLYPDWILWFNINNWESRTSIINIQELIKIPNSNISANVPKA